jgi:hypothetical protein
MEIILFKKENLSPGFAQEQRIIKLGEKVSFRA